MSSTPIAFVNETDVEVHFGLYNGPTNYSSNPHVGVRSSKNESINGNARTIAAWVDKDNLYPKGEPPFLACYVFDYAKSYVVRLTTTGITITGPDDVQVFP